jgi:demethylmenaquinone methyltransferase/2-methoxy-6-polyprenyl-1,4-benzoquinol methylase
MTRPRSPESFDEVAELYDRARPTYPPELLDELVELAGLRAGDAVVEIGCGTGLNFPLIEQEIGRDGRIIGVDITDAMLVQAQHRIETNGWGNISLVQADAAEFEFPTGVDAILATYAHSLLPDTRDVIAHGAAALSADGRWVVLDLKVPDKTPRWLAQLGIATVGRFSSLDEWIERRPWEAVRVAMQDTLADLSWTELLFGIAYLAAGARGPRSLDEQRPGSGHG